MKRFSRVFSIFLVICLLFGVAVIASATAPADKTEKIRNYDFEDGSKTFGTSYNTASYTLSNVDSKIGNRYLRFVNNKTATARYNTGFLIGTNAMTSTSLFNSGLNLKNVYDYYTVDFDLSADQCYVFVGYKVEIAESSYKIEEVYKTYSNIDENVIATDISATFSELKSGISECIKNGLITGFADADAFLKTTEYVKDADAAELSSSVNVSDALASKKLSYSNNMEFALENRVMYNGALKDTGANSLKVKLTYNQSDARWHFTVANIYDGDVVNNSGIEFVLADGIGEWNHFTYVVKVNHETPGLSRAQLYYNGYLIGTSCINIYTSNDNYRLGATDIGPRGIYWTITDYAGDCSMGIDNFVSTFYKTSYSSESGRSIADLFDENSDLKSVSQCDDVVYNEDYVSPAPNKYVEVGGKKVYVPALVGTSFKNIKNGEVVKSEIDLIGIDPPAWTSFSIECAPDCIVTLSTEAIARGTTISKTADGYRIDSGIMANMSLFTDMCFNLYLPKIDGLNILSVSNAELDENTYWVNGNEMYVISATPQINSFDPIEATVKYSMDGNEYELDILLDVLRYTTTVANLYECGSKESRLVYEIIRYKEAAAVYLDPEFQDSTGALSAFKEIYSSHADCKCVTENISIPEEELNVDYSPLMEKGVLGISYDVALDKMGLVIYVKEDTTLSGVSYKNHRGETVTHTVENGRLIEKSGYYLVESISAADINNVMTITTGEAMGTYSLGKYINNNPTVELAKRLYSYSVAAENYKSVIIPYQASHLILNNDGTYGGTFSEELYGNGAPLNGKYDVINSDYYTVNSDYYNMSSTSERVIFPKFSSYQQTMQDSSGLACLVMILNYMGEDVSGKYSELALLKKYQVINDTTVYGKGTTASGLKALVESLDLGYTAENESLTITNSDSKSTKQTKMKNFFMDNIKEGKFVLVRYTSPVGYGWKLVIGYDTLGNIQNTQTEKFTDHFGDDVIIFAEPYDGFDHCQDGYATERAQDFLVWWRDMELDGTVNETYSYLVIDPNLDIEFDYQPVDETVKQELYDIHLPLNPDGSYGGTRNSSLYGSITSGKGWWNHTDSNYYKINDFYNMGSEGSRILLPNYTILQQTMSSSCGICAVTSVLKYYGMEGDYYDLELEYLNHYENINAHEGEVKGQGTSTVGNTLALAEWGYVTEYGLAEKGNVPKYTTYEAYTAMIRENLLAGRPIVVTTNLGSGHFLTIIGYDDMGTDYIYDDVIITADSCDYWDGYQDGYNVYSAYKFFTQHTNGSYSKLQQHIIIFPKADHTHEYEGEWHTTATIFAAGEEYRECSHEGCSVRETRPAEKLEVVSVSMTQAPKKTVYEASDVGTRYDLTGMVVTAYDKNGKGYDVTTLVTLEKETVSQDDKQITVSYAGFTAAVDIRVILERVTVSGLKANGTLNESYTVEGYFVGVANEGVYADATTGNYSGDRELLIKDIETDDIIAVRNIPYGSFPDYGYKKGDRIIINATYKKDTTVITKRYLDFTSDNPDNIDGTIISSGNKIEFKLDNVTTISTWDEWKAFFNDSNDNCYTYVKLATSELFVDRESHSGGSYAWRLHPIAAASSTSAVKSDSRWTVVNANITTSNLGSQSWSGYFQTMTSTDPRYNSSHCQRVCLADEVYVLYTGACNYYFSLTILDDYWFVFNDEDNSSYTNAEVVIEVAKAYDRRGKYIQYNQTMSRRHINPSPEDATAQNMVYLDCSSFVNAVYYEAFGVNVMPYALDYTIEDVAQTPQTGRFRNYARDNQGNADVVGYWEIENYDGDVVARLSEIKGMLEIGDVINYRKAGDSAGHVLIYIGGTAFIHCSGGDYKVFDDASQSYDYGDEKANGAVYIESNYMNTLFEDTSHDRYLGKVYDVCIIRPLARGLTPTEKTEARMAMKGVTFDKTVDVGTSSAVYKNGELTYSVTVTNNGESIEYFTLRDVICDNVSFVSGSHIDRLTVDGNVLTWNLRVGVGSSVTVSWTVRVNEDAKSGSIIDGTNTTVNGIAVTKTVNTVSAYTAEEMALLVQKAKEYAAASKSFNDPMLMAKELYREVFGTDVFGEDITAVKALLEDIIDATNESLNTESELCSMVAPYLYGGRDIATLYIQNNDIVRLITNANISVGDVICAYDRSESRTVVYIYVGDSTLVAIDSADNTCKTVTMSDSPYEASHVLVTLFAYDLYAVIRPSMK